MCPMHVSLTSQQYVPWSLPRCGMRILGECTGLEAEVSTTSGTALLQIPGQLLACRPEVCGLGSDIARALASKSGVFESQVGLY